jgi:hypothetical protein
MVFFLPGFSNPDLDAVHAGDVAERLGQALVLIVDDQRSEFLDAAAVAQLADTGTHAPCGVHLKKT